MSTMIIPAEEVLAWATARVKCERNLDLMDRVTILRGYIGLTTLDPENNTYRHGVENAVAGLLPLLERSGE